jgi:hypothetical protein
MLPTFSICNLRLVVTFLSCVFKSNTFHLHDHLVTSVSKREMKKTKTEFLCSAAGNVSL